MTDDQKEHFEERAAIIEYDGGLSRAEAELYARALVFGEAWTEFGYEDITR